MRYLKFRAWQEDEKKMVGPYGIYEAERFLNPFLDTVLMQFVGLKDKNGKEIYEGDILCSADDDHNVLGIVKWINASNGVYENGFVMALPRTEFMPEMRLNIRERDEVIGNIYENPELLTNHS